jgi:hypothetical protein
VEKYSDLSDEKVYGHDQQADRGLFGDLSYSAVAKAYQRFSVNLRRDKKLRKKVETIRGKLS